MADISAHLNREFQKLNIMYQEAQIEIQRLRAEKTPDFSGLWKEVDKYKNGNDYVARLVGDILERELTKVGVTRK